MLKRVALVMAVVVATGAEARRPSQPMTGAEIQESVAGATVEIEAPLGARLPMTFAADGTMTGSAGSLAFFLGASVDTGRWWVAGNKLCQKWNRWFGGERQCMDIERDGTRIYWRNENGKSGTGIVVAQNRPAPAAPVAARNAPSAFADGGRLPRSTTTADVGRPTVAAAAQVAQAAPPAPQPTRTAAAPAQLVAEPREVIRTVPVRPRVIEVRATDDTATPPSPTPIEVTVTPPAAETDANDTVKNVRTAPSEPSRTFRVVNVRDDDVLNVRRGPSTDFDVVGELQPDSRGVVMTGTCRAVWCPVQHDSVTGWVNRLYLSQSDDENAPSREVPTQTRRPSSSVSPGTTPGRSLTFRDPPDAPRTCLTAPARALLDEIEAKFGPVKLVSTCRPGARIAGTNRISRHASGNAVDFNAGSRKAQIVAWLIENHKTGGTMTYPDMDHIHVDIGPRFVSIAGGMHWANWREGRTSF